jgi:hypothetical protein
MSHFCLKEGGGFSSGFHVTPCNSCRTLCDLSHTFAGPSVSRDIQVPQEEPMFPLSYHGMFPALIQPPELLKDSVLLLVLNLCFYRSHLFILVHS